MTLIVDAKVRFPQSGTSPQLPAGVFEARRYGDPIMVAMCGLDTRITGGNFQNILLYNPEGGFGSIYKTQQVNREAFEYLKSIQPKGGGYTITEQMNWFYGRMPETGGNPGRPYWTLYPFRWNDTGWSVSYFGTLIWGGQLVRVKVDSQNKPITTKFFAKYPAREDKEDILFYELDSENCFRRADISAGVTPATHPLKFQRCTSAEVRRDANGNIIAHNVYEPAPRGTLIHPVWSPLDFRLNWGTKLYISTDFVKAVA